MNTWDLLLRRQMMGDKLGAHNPTKPEQVNQMSENFSSPLVQALKGMGAPKVGGAKLLKPQLPMGTQSKISKGASLLGGPLAGIVPKSR